MKETWFIWQWISIGKLGQLRQLQPKCKVNGTECCGKWEWAIHFYFLTYKVKYIYMKCDMLSILQLPIVLLVQWSTRTQYFWNFLTFLEKAWYHTKLGKIYVPIYTTQLTFTYLCTYIFYSLSWIEVYGFTYKPGCVVVLRMDGTNLPAFGIIEDVLVLCTEMFYLVYLALVTECFCTIFMAIKMMSSIVRNISYANLFHYMTHMCWLPKVLLHTRIQYMYFWNTSWLILHDMTSCEWLALQKVYKYLMHVRVKTLVWEAGLKEMVTWGLDFSTMTWLI